MPARLRFDRRAIVATAIALALLVAVLVGASRVVGWSGVANAARTVDASAWAAFALLMAASYAARAVRLWRLARGVGHATLADSASVFLVHNALVTILPARIGEVAMPLLAHRWAALDWRPMVGVLAWWRLADLTVVAAIAVALLAVGVAQFAPLIAFAAAALALPWVAFGVRNGVVRRLDARVAVAPSVPAWQRLLRRMLVGMPDRRSALAVDLALALVAWTLKIAALAIVLRAALGAPLPAWPHAAAAVLAGDASGSLPVPTIAGVGPYEGALTFALSALGVAGAQAFTLALLVHGAQVASVVAAAAVGLVLRVARSVR